MFLKNLFYFEWEDIEELRSIAFPEVATETVPNEVEDSDLEDVEIAQYDEANYESIATDYRNPGGFNGIAPFALDFVSAERLWSVSEEMTQTKFDI